MADLITPDPRKIIAEKSDVPEQVGDSQAEVALTKWVMAHVQSWIDYRDTYVAKRWNDYYRLWKGEWDSSLQNRRSERSRLISPALQQAIDSGVAEISEAVFGKGEFFEVDSPKDQQPNPAMVQMRKSLSDDMKLADIRSSAEEIFLTACIWGEGIGKLATTKEKTFDLVIEDPKGPPTQKVRPVVKLHMVHPAQFAIDPAATCIDDALGMAHTFELPKHSVLEKMMGTNPIYFDKELSGAPNAPASAIMPDLMNVNTTSREDLTLLTEYHGLVPKRLLQAVLDEKKGAPKDGVVVRLFDEDVKEDVASGESYDSADDLVEAIITIANNDTLIRADENPLWMQDRAFIAFPYEKVPGQFWGRGIAEKAYNAQKALDAELRGRIDAMAYAIHPMAAMDASKLPPGFKFEVYPGKTLLTQGPPAQAIEMFNFTGPPPSSFSQSGDLERMVQMATGTPDTNASLAQNPRNSTATGMSMVAAGVLKRTKRVLANIELQFMDPLVRKVGWRYMQFFPTRYPQVEGKFRVFTSLGIMAREFEQQQLTQLLNTTAPGTPIYFLLLKGIYENSSITNKEQMMAILDQMAVQAQQPNPEQQLKVQELQVQLHDTVVKRSLEARRIAVEELRAMVEAHKTGSQIVLNQATAVMNLAKAEGVKTQTAIDGLVSLMETLQAQAERNQPQNVGATPNESNASTPPVGTGTGS